MANEPKLLAMESPHDPQRPLTCPYYRADSHQTKLAKLESAIQGERDASFILGQASAAVMIERDRIRAERDTLQQRVTDLEAQRSEAAQLSHQYRNECEALRRLLFDIYADPVLAYTDDGELQDSTAHPSIDFRRMGPEEIREAIRRREGKGGKYGELQQRVGELESQLSLTVSANQDIAKDNDSLRRQLEAKGADAPECVGWIHEVTWIDGVSHSLHSNKPEPLQESPTIVSQRIGKALFDAAIDAARSAHLTPGEPT